MTITLILHLTYNNLDISVDGLSKNMIDVSKVLLY